MPPPNNSVVQGGDVLKDDFGSYAIFTEQGSSADVLAYCHAKMEDAPKVSGLVESGCPTI